MTPRPSIVTIFVGVFLCCRTSLAFQPKSLSRRSMTTSQLFATDTGDVIVMVNGMPGRMATAAAEACLRKGLKLAPAAMTGPEVEPCTITVSDASCGKSTNVRLIPSNNVDEVRAAVAGLKEASNMLIAIDYTHPSSVNENARFYVQNNIPFVMGTTGGDREQLAKDANNHFCIIAPNMAKQIVAMQAGLEKLAKEFPGAFAGYKLSVRESHQKTKADTSGTAKAVVDHIKVLASDPDYSYDDIELIRDDDEAIKFGVPPDALSGHAFHTYTLTSPDGTTQFALSHNVAGRTIYAEGTADAVKFLAKKIQTEKNPRVYNMINVLEEGALE